MNCVTKRLMEERNKWRQDPAQGFTANPVKNEDGTLNLFKWSCEIPGPRNTAWADGRYKLVITFNRDYLDMQPTIQFTPSIFHPNVARDGYICSDLDSFWPDISIKQLLFCVQSFLEKPNPFSAYNQYAASLYTENRERYDSIVRSGFLIEWKN